MPPGTSSMSFRSNATPPADHEESFKCTTCHATFGRRDLLAEHVKIHDKRTRFWCESCPKSYVRFDGLIEHHYRTHQDEMRRAAMLRSTNDFFRHRAASTLCRCNRCVRARRARLPVERPPAGAPGPQRPVRMRRTPPMDVGGQEVVQSPGTAGGSAPAFPEQGPSEHSPPGPASAEGE